jgi:threonine dehydrogenase-like Zn-dependent dehydrogenase
MSSIQSNIFELTGPKELHLRSEILDFKSVTEHEIIAQTVYSAISPGTEISAFAGATPLRPGKIYPRLLGYCNVATVIHIGSKVSKFNIDDNILSFQSHRSAFKMHEDDFAILLEKGTDLKHAVTAYLFHLGYHGLLTAEARAGHNIGIIGIGTLGYAASIMSNLIGANTFAFTNQPVAIRRLEKQKIFSFKKSSEVSSEINNLTLQTGLDIVLNTSNKWEDWKLALELVNKGGTIVNIGFPGRDEPLPTFNPLDPQYVYMKNVAIKSLSHITDHLSNYYDARFNIKLNLLYILRLIKEKRLNPDDLISAEIKYPELGKLYEQYLNRKQSLLSSIIEWS